MRLSVIAAPLLIVFGATFGTGCDGESDSANPPPGGSSGTTDPNPDPDDEDCEPDATKECSIPVGTQGGTLLCLEGHQTCGSDRMWGECEGTLESRSLPAYIPDGMTREQLNDPAWFAGWKAQIEADRPWSIVDFRKVDADDPLGDVATEPRNHTVPPSGSCGSACDPACQTFPDPIVGTVATPGSPPPPAPPGGSFESALSNIAGGLWKKLGLLEGDCNPDPPGVKAPCNADTHCVGSGDESECVPWLPGQYDLTAPGYDLTVGFGCGGVLGSVLTQIPVCNRGKVAFSGNVTIELHPGNSGSIGDCTKVASPNDTCTFAASLAPGACMIAPPTCTDGVSANSNNKSYQIDGQATVSTTGVFDEGGPGVGGAGFPDCNNWGFYDKGVSCSPSACANAGDAQSDNCGGKSCQPSPLTNNSDSNCELKFHSDRVYLSYFSGTTVVAEWRLTDASTAWQPMTQVANAAACTSGNQYYFTLGGGGDHYHVHLCSALCQTATALSDFRFTATCGTTYTSVTNTVAFDAGVCPVGQRTTWQYVGWRGTTPGDSKITFKTRSSSTDPLGAGAFKPLAVAAAAVPPNSPAICTFTGPAPNCPVSLYNALGLPDATNRYLEIQYTLDPGTGSAFRPTLDDLQVSFSCPASE